MLNVWKPIAYIASGCGFTPSRKKFYAEVVEFLRKTGWDVRDPWVLTDYKHIKKAESLPRGLPQEMEFHENVNPLIFKNNMKALEEAKAVLCILSTDQDPGACFEVGVAYAKGLPIEILWDSTLDVGDNPGCYFNIMPFYGTLLSGGHISREMLDFKSKIHGLRKKLIREHHAAA